jgi:TolB-like protein/DNA-binding SARP family transcriptional activator
MTSTPELMGDRRHEGAGFRLKLLGHFEIIAPDGSAISINNKKNRAILAILALAPGCQATREQICGLLWAERGDEQARSSLRQSLTVLRKELGVDGARLLQTADDRLMLRTDLLSDDVTRFLKLSEATDSGSLGRAAALYQGPLLADTSIRDPSFEDWLAGEQRRLGDRAIAVLDRLVSFRDLPDRVDLARRLLDLDPLRESSHRALMRVYAEAGETALSLQQFEACRAMLQKEFQVGPAKETQALRDAIASGDIASSTGAGDAVRAAGPPSDEVPDRPSARPEAAKPVSGKLSIAVLPFLNLTGDAQQDYLAEGIAEDIITELGRFSSLTVIGRSSSFRFRGGSLDSISIGAELHAQYLLEGSIRQVGDKFRVSTRLLEAATASQVWSERYDRPKRDLLEVQDDMIASIITTFEHRLSEAKALQLRTRPPSNWDAYDFLLQARHELSSYEGMANAETPLLRAIAINPNLTEAHAKLAHVAMGKYWSGDGDPAHIDEALAFARTALSLDQTESTAHAAMSVALAFKREFNLALFHADEALRLNPNNLLAATNRAMWLTFLGRNEEAFQALQDLLRRDPYPPMHFWEVMGATLYQMGRCEEALAAYRRNPNPQNWEMAYIVACQWQLGRKAEARDALVKLGEAYPDFSISRLLAIEIYQTEAAISNLAAPLRAAGLRD